MLTRVFVLAVVWFVNAKPAVLRGKGLLCRDPDTGKFHPLNTIWASTTFCGNYTCKLRKSNQTVVQEPIREFNVTNLTFTDERVTNKTFLNSTDNVKNSTTFSKLEPLLSEIRYEMPLQRSIKDDNSKHDDDRYLTEDEVQSIANVLHKIKKSDVEALVDVYALAQEIYHEMDKTTDQETIIEPVNNLKQGIHYSDSNVVVNGKLKDTEARSTSTDHNYLYLTNKLKKKNVADGKNPSYFNGPLTAKDFGQIPYYYPISTFQRMSSYVHQPNQRVKAPAHAPLNTKINKEERIQYPQMSTNVETKDHQKVIKPSYLLPYPFSYVNKYNLSKFTNIYTRNPWVWDYYYRRNKQTPYLNAYLTHIPYSESIFVNSYLHNREKKQDNGQSVKKTQNRENIKKEEPWKTEPLSSHIINEIKANFNTQRIKAFPLRKKVELEKVGSVRNIDKVSRSRRSTNEIDNSVKKEAVNAKQGMEKPQNIVLVEGEYEVVVEKITCQPQTTTVGFFRYGNLTEPYPQCCPQLIRNR